MIQERVSQIGPVEPGCRTKGIRAVLQERSKKNAEGSTNLEIIQPLV